MLDPDIYEPEVVSVLVGLTFVLVAIAWLVLRLF